MSKGIPGENPTDSTGETIDNDGDRLAYQDHDYVIRELGGNWVPYARTEINNFGHVVWRVSGTKSANRQSLPVHRLLAVAEYGTEAVKDKVVHHKNNIPFDNRLSNIELMDSSEHARHHNAGQYHVSDLELKLDLRAGAEFLGYPPRASEIEAFSEHTLKTYRTHFGSVAAAYEAAGIDPETGEITKEVEEL
jgi:hypothetical protein